MFHRSIATIWTISLLAASLLYSLPSAAKKPSRQEYPKTGKVLRLTNGDLMCYVDLIDKRGKKYQLGADFQVCQQSQFLNKYVRLTYKPIKVNDCQSIEPCGKSKVIDAIVGMKLISGK